MSEAIFAHQLKKRYPPDVTALAGLGVAVDEGTIFGLLGPNSANIASEYVESRHADGSRLCDRL